MCWSAVFLRSVFLINFDGFVEKSLVSIASVFFGWFVVCCRKYALTLALIHTLKIIVVFFSVCSVVAFEKSLVPTTIPYKNRYFLSLYYIFP